MQMVLIVELIVAVGNDKSGEDDQQELKRVRGDQDPAFAGREKTVEAGEEERAGTERDNGGDCFNPADAFRGGDDTETEINRVALQLSSEGRFKRTASQQPKLDTTTHEAAHLSACSQRSPI